MTSPGGRCARAVWFTRPGEVELREEPVGEPGPGQVRVRTVASGISAGTELLVLRGEVSPDLPLDLPTLRGSFAFPVKYGYATVGRVLRCGDGVETLHAGDLVFVHHPHQDELVVDASLPVPLPEDADPQAATLLANLETAVNVVLDLHPHLGDRAVVFGAGVVGLLVVQLLRRAGVEAVVSVDPSAQRREHALTLGATVAVAPGEETAAAVAELGRGRGADVVVEASGHAAALDEAIRCAGFQATVLVCSWYGTKPVSLNLGGTFHRGRLRLVSSQVSSVDPALAPRWDAGRRRALAARLLTELPLQRMVTDRVPLEHAADAYRRLLADPAGTLQVVLTYDGAGADV